jgi:hyaluronan synthase
MQPARDPLRSASSPTSSDQDVMDRASARGLSLAHGSRAGIAPRHDATPLTGHGSHKRLIDRKARRSTPKIAEDATLSRGETVARVAFAALVIAVFGTSLATSVVSTLLTASSFVVIVVTSFGVALTSFFIATCIAASRYKAVASHDDARLPMLTILVPAYNEGANVRVALESALASDYPADRLEILAIDDGSTDDTWSHIESVAAAHPGRITPIRQPKNGGKREALRAGFARAEGELLVTIDSDSKIEPTALRAIVAPMIDDESIAAVAGRVLVLNRDDNWLTRILSARFFLTFDLARAAQSRAGAVLCTPGALSAYRKSAVDAVVERWSEQTFLGQPCTIAEDRALTTWLLRTGHRSVYQRTAVVRTIMPTTFARVARMMIRWERGNIREDLVMLPLLATKWRDRDRLWPALEVGFELLQYPVAWLSFGLLAARVLDHPLAIVSIAGCVALGAVVQSLWILRSSRIADFVYGVQYAIFAFVGLQWIFPYSLLTVRDGRWLTR